MEILPAAPDADYTVASRFYEFRCLMSPRYVRRCFLYLAIAYTRRRRSDDVTKRRRVRGVLRIGPAITLVALKDIKIR